MDSDRSQGHSNNELLSSAKGVAEAAQSTLSNQSEKVAVAAGDLLESARQYGKLDDKGMGNYVDKAEDYLHQYAGHGATGQPPEHPKPAEAAHSGEDHSSSKPESLGGAGDYLKKAQDFLKK